MRTCSCGARTPTSSSSPAPAVDQRRGQRLEFDLRRGDVGAPVRGARRLGVRSVRPLARASNSRDQRVRHRDRAALADAGDHRVQAVEAAFEQRDAVAAEFAAVFDHRFEQRFHRVAEFAHGHDAGHARAALERVQVALQADQRVRARSGASRSCASRPSEWSSRSPPSSTKMSTSSGSRSVRSSASSGSSVAGHRVGEHLRDGGFVGSASASTARFASTGAIGCAASASARLARLACGALLRLRSARIRLLLRRRCVRLRGARLRGVRLRGVRLRGVRLRGVRLRGVRLRRVRLRGVRLRGVRLRARSASRRSASSAFGFERVRLRRVRLRRVRLRRVRLRARSASTRSASSAFGFERVRLRARSASTRSASRRSASSAFGFDAFGFDALGFERVRLRGARLRARSASTALGFEACRVERRSCVGFGASPSARSSQHDRLRCRRRRATSLQRGVGRDFLREVEDGGRSSARSSSSVEDDRRTSLDRPAASSCSCRPASAGAASARS